MSKRGTDNQITKDDYEREEDDNSSSVIGTFRMASTDELARRPMRAMRRLGARTSSNVSDEGAKKGSAFASMGPLATSNSSQTPPPENTAKPANPFANVSFGSTSSFSESTPAITTAATTQPAFTFGGFGQPAPAPAFTSKPGPTNTTASSTTTAFSATPAATPAFGNSAFTFNIGSNATPLTAVETAPLSESSMEFNPHDRDAYHRSLRRVNHSFLKKIEKTIEALPMVNLSQLFNQYVNHRMKVRKSFIGVEEPRAIVVRSDGPNKKRKDSEDGSSGSASTISRINSGSGNSPKMGFGLPVDLAANAAPQKPFAFGTSNIDSKNESLPSRSGILPVSPVPVGPAASPSGFPSLPSAGGFGFGTSSMKGAVDPPRNPTTTSGWGFGAPNSISSFGSSATSFGSLTSTAPATSFVTTSASTAASAPKPFAFNAPKPFSFTTPAGASAVTAAPPPKPFAFQVPPAASSSSSTVNNSENEKMPDDTKSQLVDTREGEEGESTVFEVRAKLYSFVDNEPKDLGVGQFRVNENSETKKRRMIMRTGGTGLITLNSWVIPGMPPKREKTAVTVFAIEDGKPRKFVLRVKEESSAEALFNALEAGQTKS